MLDEALGWSGAAPRNKLLLIKDSVASPASFLLLYLLNKIFAFPDSLVIFVGLKEPFSHYSRIARKQGCNLVVHRDRGSLVYIDLLSKSILELSNLSPDVAAASVGNKLFPLFQSFLKILKQAPGRNVWIVIDDIPLLEVVAEGNSTYVQEFLHYCRTLASNKQAFSLMLLTHRDVYETTEETRRAYQLEYLSDTVINVEPLATGQASDVHGQIIVEHRMPSDTDSSAHLLNGYGLHYKLMENGVLFFAPGKQI
eukprot:c12791_g1_i1 orf=276-1037(-)